MRANLALTPFHGHRPRLPSTFSLLAFGARVVLLVGRPPPRECKMFSGIPGLHPLHANSTPPTKMSPDTKDTTLHDLTPTQTLPVSRVPEPAVTVELGHSARDKGSPGLSGSIFNSRTSRLSPSPAWGLLAAAWSRNLSPCSHGGPRPLDIQQMSWGLGWCSGGPGRLGSKGIV